MSEAAVAEQWDYEQPTQQQEQLQQSEQSAIYHENTVGDLGLGLDDDDDDDDEEDDILDDMEDGGMNGNNNNNNSKNNNNNSAGGVLLMRFCPHDSSMLYPKEDRRTKTLKYACGLCRYNEETHTSMVYQNILKQEVGNVLHKVLSAVSDDPSLPRTLNENCESCGNNEAVFFQSDTSDVRNDSLALIFVCCGCGHKWVK